jgi:Cu+-exporting ATPase
MMVDQNYVGSVGFHDVIKPFASEMVQRLREVGVETIIFSGDQRHQVEAVAKKTGVSQFRGFMKPEEKAAAIQDLRNQGKIVAMAGDGINDAPALAAADVGIAMGTGTDVAIENAGITLLKGDLRGIVRARKLSRATIRNIKQNLAWAFLYNLIGIPIAAGVFYPIFGWLLSPMLASAAMSFSSVSVIANALRLRKTAL